MPGRGSAFASAFSPRATAVTLLQRSKYWFELSFAGNNQNFPAEAAQTVKLITIFMPEFLANTLGKHRTFNQIPSGRYGA